MNRMFRFLKQKNKKISKPLGIFLLVALILTVSGTGFLYPHVTHAQPYTPGANYGVAAANLLTGHPIDALTSAVGAPSAGEIALAVFKTFATQVSEIMLRATSLGLYIAGMILKFIITVSVVKMKFIVDAQGVRAAWTTFRDIANMFFIFIILYIAISTILGTGINMRKTLVRVVIVALLLNFSFFFTKIAVDFSNILTIGFYNQIANSPCGPGGTPAGDLGSAFMCRMGLPEIWSPEALTAVAGNVADNASVSNIMIRGIMGSLFFLITGFVFLAAGLMFLARFVAFIFLFMLSPLAFGAMALPSDRYSDQWKESLLSNCLFAPAFMLTVWATLTVLDSVNKAIFPNGHSYNLMNAIMGGTNGAPAPSAGETFINYAIVIAMIIGSLIVAKRFGAYGAGGAIKLLSKSRNTVQGFVGKHTIGRAASATDKYLESKGFDSRTSRYIRDYTTGALAKSKFGGGQSFKDYSKEVKEQKADIANKGRERDNLKILKTAAEAGATLAQIQEAERVLARMSNKEIEGLGYKNLAPHISRINASQLEHVLEKSEKFNEKEKADLREKRFENVKNLVNTNDPNARQAIRALSDKEVELVEPELMVNPVFIGHLNEGQVENLLKSTRVIASQKKAVRDERNRPFKAAVAAANSLAAGAAVAAVAAARQAIDIELKKMKPQKVAKLDSSDLISPHVISQLTPAMLSKMPDEQDAATLQAIGNWIRNNSPRGGPAYDYITTGLGRGLF